jgi:hypothetical protein
MAAQLAPIYLDNNRVTLQGDPRPNVAKILSTAGKRPEKVRVVRLNRQNDTQGSALNPNDVIDRAANAATPVYLHCEEGAAPMNEPYGKSGSGMGSGKTGQASSTFTAGQTGSQQGQQKIGQGKEEEEESDEPRAGHQSTGEA